MYVSHSGHSLIIYQLKPESGKRVLNTYFPAETWISHRTCLLTATFHEIFKFALIEIIANLPDYMYIRTDHAGWYSFASLYKICGRLFRTLSVFIAR